MRVTRGDSLYENFEYWAAKGRLWAKAHPGGAYPKNMPRMRDLKGVGVGHGTIFRQAIFSDTPEYCGICISPAVCRSELGNLLDANDQHRVFIYTLESAVL